MHLKLPSENCLGIDVINDPSDAFRQRTTHWAQLVKATPLILRPEFRNHYSDVIMGAIASQITASRLFTQPFSQTQIKEKNQSSASLAFCEGGSPGTGEFHSQKASNAENGPI